MIVNEDTLKTTLNAIKTLITTSISSVYTKLGTKQDTLVSGTTIKTINNESILGEGNITIEGGGNIDDVKVNGVSVVTDKVANIDTSGLAEKTELETKQDKLIAGDNITIDSDNKISASGGGKTEVQIGGSEPTDEDIVLWYDSTDEGYIISYPNGDELEYGTEASE